MEKRTYIHIKEYRLLDRGLLMSLFVTTVLALMFGVTKLAYTFDGVCTPATPGICEAPEPLPATPNANYAPPNNVPSDATGDVEDSVADVTIVLQGASLAGAPPAGSSCIGGVLSDGSGRLCEELFPSGVTQIWRYPSKIPHTVLGSGQHQIPTQIISMNLDSPSSLLSGDIKITASGQVASGISPSAPGNTLNIPSVGKITTKNPVPPEFGPANPADSFFDVFVDVNILSGPYAGISIHNDANHPAIVQAVINKIPPFGIFYNGLPTGGAVPLGPGGPPIGTDTLWITDGITVANITTAGAVLSSFPVPAPLILGLVTTAYDLAHDPVTDTLWITDGITVANVTTAGAVIGLPFPMPAPLIIGPLSTGYGISFNPLADDITVGKLWITDGITVANITTAGAVLSAFPVPAPLIIAPLSLAYDLAHDPVTDTLWITDGITVANITTAGAVLSAFPVPAPLIIGPLSTGYGIAFNPLADDITVGKLWITDGITVVNVTTAGIVVGLPFPVPAPLIIAPVSFAYGLDMGNVAFNPMVMAWLIHVNHRLFAEKPTAITLASFKVTFEDGQNHISWITGTEINTEGFHILRSTLPGGPYNRITPSLIMNTGSIFAGGSYSFVDTVVEDGNNYYYKVEEVDTLGNLVHYGPVAAVAIQPMSGVSQPSQGALDMTLTSIDSFDSQQSQDRRQEEFAPGTSSPRNDGPIYAIVAYTDSPAKFLSDNTVDAGKVQGPVVEEKGSGVEMKENDVPDISLDTKENKNVSARNIGDEASHNNEIASASPYNNIEKRDNKDVIGRASTEFIRFKFIDADGNEVAVASIDKAYNSPTPPFSKEWILEDAKSGDVALQNRWDGDTVIITWYASKPVKGFHILRSVKKDGPYQKITKTLIPYFSKTSDSQIFRYTYTDMKVEKGKNYYYKLEAVAIDQKGGLKLGKVGN